LRKTLFLKDKTYIDVGDRHCLLLDLKRLFFYLVIKTNTNTDIAGITALIGVFMRGDPCSFFAG
jgi:hypothetical protein